MLKYAEEKGIPVKATAAKPYSEDDNLLHISHEAGILEDPSKVCDKEIYSKTASPQEAPDKITKLKVSFKDGLPIKVENLDDGTFAQEPLELFQFLNKIGSENGIGRLDMVENRYVGIKSRGVYESPGAYILWEAHKDIEGIAMDRDVMHLRDSLIPKFSELIYNGYWFSPEMDFLMSAFNKSQELIDGEVILEIYKGNVMTVSRKSPTSLYNQELGSMDIEGGFDQTDSKGFIKINGLRLKAHKAIIDKRGLGSYKVAE
jgi:argininosuccinate synthase